MGAEILVPAAMGLISTGMGYYGNQQAMRNQENMADTAYDRQLQFQKAQQDWQTQTEARNKSWIQEQQAAQQAAHKAQQADNEAKYQKYAYANKEATDARRNQLVADAANSRETALDQLSRSMSVRGWGPGSGAVSAAAGDVSNKYLKDLGSAYNQVTEFANKPAFAYPFSTSSSFTPAYSLGGSSGMSQGSSSYGGNGYTNSGSNPLASAMGMYLYKTMMNNNANDAYNPQYDSAFDNAQLSMWGLDG